MSDIPAAVLTAAQHWHLIIGEPMTGGTRSAVFAASDRQGRDLVIKIPAARNGAAEVMARESAALAVWSASEASVRMVDATAKALLLVRSRPGTLMPSVTAETLESTVEIAAELLERLWNAKNSSAVEFPGQSMTYAEDERIAVEDAAFEQEQSGDPERGRPGLELLPRAAGVAEELIKNSGPRVLLHGDFITKNLLRDQSSPVGYVAIDPLPQLGDPASEVADFAAYQPADLIFPVAESLARRLELDPGRVLRWTAIRLVHQTAQAWRDDQQLLERLVRTVTVGRLLRHPPLP